MYAVEHEAFREEFKEFLDEHVVPAQGEWRRSGAVSREVWRAAGDAGFLGITMPREQGGRGADFLYSMVMCQELSRIHEVAFGILLHNDIVVPYIEELGAPEQRARYLDACRTGDAICAFAMTEPSGGSDVAGIKTTAVPDGQGEGWVINGTKIFIANGQLCDVAVVVAVTDPEAPRAEWGLSLFLVDSDRPGFVKGRNLETVGMLGQDTSEIKFEDCWVPAGSLLGSEGRAFQYVMERLPRERLIVSMLAYARAEQVLKETVERVKGREVFGRPLSTFQNSVFVLSDCAADVRVGGAFLERVVKDYIEGREVMVDSAVAKLWATELLCRISDACFNLWGAHGALEDNGVGRALADARMQRIYAGTNEVMRMIIGRDMGLGG